jgi:hypothetical protein
MRYFYVVVTSFALSTVLAVSAMTLASTASAQPTYTAAVWFRGGVEVTTDLTAAESGELLLEDTEGGPTKLKVSVLCSGIIDGFVGDAGFDEDTELLTLGGESISVTPLSGKSLSCARENLCESSKVWLVNLPWRSELLKWKEGANEGFVDLYLPGGSGRAIGWYTECTIVGVKATDECTTTQGAAETFAGGESIYSEANTLLFSGKLASCTASSKETGVIEGSTEGFYTEGGKLEP